MAAARGAAGEGRRLQVRRGARGALAVLSGLVGGAGLDAFVFDTAPNKATNVDALVDFSHADDTMLIDNAVFKAVGKNGKLARDAFASAKKALDAEDRVVYDRASGALSCDADGTGKIAAIKIAILQSEAKIEASDFFVV